MKKFARTLCVLMLSVVMLVSCFALTACPKPGPDGPDAGSSNNETRPLVFSVGELDNVFNPYFSTSGYDSEITGNTQIAMLTSNSAGQVYCGEDEPTVARNYSQTIYYRENSTDDLTAYPNGAAPDLGDKLAEDIDPEDYFTEYKFLIKNNIKFSDGKDLTIKDVIFNLYTYLDPTYYGSSTIYSTAIQGLEEYRLQKTDVNDSDTDSFNQTMNKEASDRITLMRRAYNTSTTNEATTLKTSTRNQISSNETAKSKFLKDVETARNMFYDEIVSDYTAAEAALESYIEENNKPGNEASELGFTEVWEVFLYNEGIISATFKANGEIDTYDVDDMGTRKDGSKTKAGDKMIDYRDTWKWWHDKNSLITIVFNSMAAILDTDQLGEYIADPAKGVMENDVLRPSNPQDGPITDITVDELGKANGSTIKANDAAEYWNLLWSDSTTYARNVYNIVSYWATANSIRDQFIAEAKAEYFEDNRVEGGLAVDSIKGITVEKLSAGDTFSGQFGNTAITEEQYVLSIKIDRVDPKAIWNFAFAVAPMHYYSNAENSGGAYTAADDYRAFNYPGTPGYDASKAIHVGRPFGQKDYLDKVLKASNIISVPVGAGMYQVASYDTRDYYAPENRPSFTQFSSNNVVYYIRNPYFYTTSGQANNTPETSKISNCKIKFIRYKVITTARLLDSVLTGEVDYGDPSATQSNMEKLQADSKISVVEVDNNGYGYIGINATYVPDLEVRRAIMHTMNLDLIKTYYGRFAEIIYRPVSTVSWASPQNTNNEYYGTITDQYYEYLPGKDGTKMEAAKAEIVDMVEGAGYQKVGGIYQRTLDDGTTHKLEYTFTIAGASDDHPAYTTMQNSANILNDCGFKVTVKTDSQALSKLSAGTLAVWAAAWSSANDPDMYQVYHMDSTATSVDSWGYPTIIEKRTTATYSEQYGIIEELAGYIEAARTVLDTATRAQYYYEAYNTVMDLAVELPTYQRKNIYAYNSNIVDSTTLNQAPTPYSGPLARLWEVSLKG
ncbi:MAG: hypothetical protein IKC48_04075 [Clostridia bacterium]|nr:hypothetical protein [Clostridia bacterium]